jgi:MarR family transcriptional regulator, 2-MHQ and catechol-resistance regulon repressor
MPPQTSAMPPVDTQPTSEPGSIAGPDLGQAAAPLDGSAANGARVATVPPQLDRRSLEKEVLDVMTAWSPREREGAFKTWHRHALSLVHLNVLTALEVEGPLSMRRLAEAMDVSDASATGIVDRMEKRGIVERRHDTSDRRIVLVYLTDAGAKVFRDMAAHRRQVLEKVLDRLSGEEMGALLVGMRAVQAARRELIEKGIAADPEPRPRE